jgi:hypothetical protein
MQQYQVILRYNALPDAEKIRLTREAEAEWLSDPANVNRNVPIERMVFIGAVVLERFTEELQRADLDRTGAQ